MLTLNFGVLISGRVTKFVRSESSPNAKSREACVGVMSAAASASKAQWVGMSVEATVFVSWVLCEKESIASSTVDNLLLCQPSQPAQ